MEGVGERIALGFAEAERQRRANVPGAEVLEIDGLLLAFANVPDPAGELGPRDLGAARIRCRARGRGAGRSASATARSGWTSRRAPSVGGSGDPGGGAHAALRVAGDGGQVDDLPALLLPDGHPGGAGRRRARRHGDRACGAGWVRLRAGDRRAVLRRALPTVGAALGRSSLGTETSPSAWRPRTCMRARSGSSASRSCPGASSRDRHCAIDHGGARVPGRSRVAARQRDEPRGGLRTARFPRGRRVGGLGARPSEPCLDWLSGDARILARVTVLGGEPAVPCTRNPL